MNFEAQFQLITGLRVISLINSYVILNIKYDKVSYMYNIGKLNGEVLRKTRFFCE